MRIAFLQNLWHVHLGVVALAGSIRKAGHDVAVFVAGGEKDLIGAVSEWTPDIVGFSCSTHDHRWVLETASKIKAALQVPVILGGPHATFFPEIIREPQVDLVCVGEGDEALPELLDKLAAGGDVTAIRNIWAKRDGEIVRNELRPLIEHLDDLPLPDRTIYYKYLYLRRSPAKHFIAGRGCVFSCHFCYNYALKKMYRGKGKYVRMNKAERVVEEIKEIKDKFGMRLVVFDDDTFTTNRDWLFSFLPIYRREIGVPFVCNVRADTVDESVVKALRDGGCFRVCIGVETGNETLRREVLGKRVTNEEIEETVKLLRKYHVKFLTNNMVGLPGETIEQAFETVELNARLRTDFPWCSILHFYPKTRVAEIAREKGLLDQGESYDTLRQTFFETSELKQKDMNQILNLQKLFNIGVRLPWTMPILRVLVKLPLRRLYHIIFLVTFGYRYMKANMFGLRDMIVFGWQNARLYSRR